MKILLIGATGTLGRAVHTALRERGHEIVTAARRNADVPVDLTDPATIGRMYARVGAVDAVACAAGPAPWRPLAELSLADVRDGLAGKAVSQVEVVRQGLGAVADDGSFTLVTGVTAREPVRTGAVAALANGAIEAFVRAAAIELPGRRRVNAVSPTVFEESLAEYDTLFPGFDAVPVRRAAAAYVRSVEGHDTGQVYRVG
ncbi:short chain dehydrogenase [Streptomyces capparidis]